MRFLILSLFLFFSITGCQAEKECQEIHFGPGPGDEEARADSN